MQKGIDVHRLAHDGPANHVRHVIEELRRRGHSVRLLSQLDRAIWQSDDLVTFEPVELKDLDAGPWRWFERGVRRIQSMAGLPYVALFDSLRFAWACRQVLADCDLLFERRNWMTYGGALAAHWLKIPLVYEDNGDPLLDLEAKGMAPQGLQRRLSLAIMRRSMHSAAHIVASGQGWRQACIDRWGLEPRQVTVIENGSVLVELLQRHQLRSFQTSTEDNRTTTLVYLGGFYPWHGINILLRAFAQASAQTAAQGRPARLLLIGSGAGFDEALALTQELAISHCVTFAGHLPPGDYAPLLADADIGLSPYCGWPEFSGLKVLDYKAVGLAIIASGQGGQPSTLRHQHSGWIIPPCDEGALTNAMVQLICDGDLRRRLGQSARIEAERNHSWRHTVSQLEQIFDSVVAQRPLVQLSVN